MANDLRIGGPAAPPATPDHPLVAVLVRILTADGLTARRTSPDRLEVSQGDGLPTEWCCVADLMFGRSTGNPGEASWVHRLPAGPEVAPFELGREVSRIVRRQG